MPREIVHPSTYACTTCAREHATFTEAEKCEARGVKPFHFHTHQVVAYKNDLGKHSAVIHSAGGEEERVDPHEGPEFYYGYIDLKNFRIKKRDIDLVDLDSTRLSTRKHHTACCPLCKSRNLLDKNEERYFFSISTEVLFAIDNVEHTECQDCKTDYFTESQLQAMLTKAAEVQSAQAVMQK